MIDRYTLQRCAVIIAIAYEEADKKRGIANRAKRLEQGVLDVIDAYESAKDPEDDHDQRSEDQASYDAGIRQGLMRR